jgi:hypothetical protein
MAVCSHARHAPPASSDVLRLCAAGNPKIAGDQNLMRTEKNAVRRILVGAKELLVQKVSGPAKKGGFIP